MGSISKLSLVGTSGSYKRGSNNNDSSNNYNTPDDNYDPADYLHVSNNHHDSSNYINVSNNNHGSSNNINYYHSSPTHYSASSNHLDISKYYCPNYSASKWYLLR